MTKMVELTQEQRELSRTSLAVARELFNPEDVNRWREEHGLPSPTSLAISQFLINDTDLFDPDVHTRQYLEAVLVVEQFSRVAAAALPLVTDLTGIFCLKILDAHRYVVEYSNYYADQGRFLFAFCTTEKDSGSDLRPAQLTTTVRRENGIPTLNGQKTFVNNGEFCPALFVLAKDMDAYEQGMTYPNSLWLVPNGVSGIRAFPIKKKGQGILPFADVVFDNVLLTDEDNLLKASNVSNSMLTRILCADRLLGCAACLGMAQGAMDDAAAHAIRRSAFGQSIGNYQLVQEMIVRMQVKIDSMRGFVYAAAHSYDEEGDYRYKTALAKWYVPQTAVEVVSDAIQLFGAAGYTSSERVYGAWEDCRGYQIASGTDQIMMTIAAPRILTSYAENPDAIIPCE